MQQRRSEKTLAEKTRCWLEEIAPYNTHRMTLNWQRAALLVVDMQNEFLLPGLPTFVEGARAIVPNLVKLVKAFRQCRRPVLYTAHAHFAPKADGGMTAWWWPEIAHGRSLRAGTRNVEVFGPLAPRPGEIVVTKQRYSAFYDTNLELALRGLGVRDLVITGVMTSVCCESTARDAFFRDFRVFFLADATACGHEEMHVGTLRNLAYAFAYVTTTATILRRLTGWTQSGFSCRVGV